MNKTQPNDTCYRQIMKTIYNTKPCGLELDKYSVAPMLEITNKYWRFLARLLTHRATLYTEMIHQDCILNHKDGHMKLLDYEPCENKLVLQLGGNDPNKLAQCAILAQQMGYDEINLNVGCPSSRVQDGCFGACLMANPERVAQCMNTMQQAVSIPCTVKCRLGIDHHDSYEFVHTFVKTVSEQSSTTHFLIHARKALLQGLSPTQNRNIPPLQYFKVYQLKTDFPHLHFSINGGFKTFEQIHEALGPDQPQLAGVMVGRASYENPWMMGDIDRQLYGKSNPGLSRREVLSIWSHYAQHKMETEEASLSTMNKPIIHLFNGEKHGNKFKRYLSDQNNFKACGRHYPTLIQQAIAGLEKYNPEILDNRHP